MAYQPKSYRKFVATAATATLVASAVAPAALAASSFTDVAPKYKEAVDYLFDNGITKGKTEELFGTHQNITRGELAIWLTRALGLEEEAKEAAASGFADTAGTYYDGYVSVLKEAKILDGKSSKEFGVNDFLTRGQMAKLLSNAYGLTSDEKAPFEDMGQFEPFISGLYAWEITSGKTEELFGTSENITRGDLAIFLFRAEQTVDVAPEFDYDGETTIELAYGEEFTLPEVTATDDYDADVKVTHVITDAAGKAVDKIDTKTPGTYTVTYTAEDSAGNVAELELTVKVAELVVNAPVIESVSAINAKQAQVNFKNALPEGVDFTNFELNGGLTVADVKFSSDRKSATITASSEFTRNQEYTVSVFGIKDAEGKEYAETKGTFTWEVAEGVTVALEATTLEQGQAVGLTVKDQAGKDVANAVVNVTSFNENLVTVTNGVDASPSDVVVTANNAKLAGATDVVVETTLPDGSVLTNTFQVTVKEAVTTVSSAGYSLVAGAGSLASLDETMANTVAFKSFASAKTSVVEGSGDYELAAFGETNYNPDAQHINFTGATRVVSSNPIVATANLTDDGTTGVITVTPLTPGTTTVTVTMKDGSRKTFPITVTAAPVQKSISVNATNVKLSDEHRTEAADYQEGVDSHTFKITSLNQFDKAIAFTAGKVTVSSSTDGLELVQGTTPLVAGSNEVDFAGASSANVTIVAKKDTPVSNAKVTVSYFAKATDTKPTVTKTITVNVADIDPDALTSSIDVKAASEIDANAEVSLAESVIDFTSTPVYALDSKGNRLELLDAQATIAEKDAADKFVTVDEATETLQFRVINDALTYLRSTSTVDVVVTADGVTKVLPITYKNTAVVPNKATVSTSAVSIKLTDSEATSGISVEDIIFGIADNNQLILDDADLDTVSDDVIGVLKTAKNAGYKYNKPLTSILGTDGKALATGVNVYGSDLTTNAWNNALVEALKGYDITGFSASDFTVDYMIANANDSSTIAGGVVNPVAGKATTFTLVIKGIYVNGSVLAIEGATPTAAEQAAHNLLAAPVQLNVSVTK